MQSCNKLISELNLKRNGLVDYCKQCNIFWGDMIRTLGYWNEKRHSTPASLLFGFQSPQLQFSQSIQAENEGIKYMIYKEGDLMIWTWIRRSLILEEENGDPGST